VAIAARASKAIMRDVYGSEPVDHGSQSQDDITREHEPQGVRGDIFDLKPGARDPENRETQRDDKREMVRLLGSKKPSPAS
jgi:hypothetical protein